MEVEANSLAKNIEENWQQIKAVIKKERPLIHQISNYVSASDSANITLNWGALPVMASAPEEAAEMVESASALLINLGTLNQERLKAIFKAGKRANQLNIPVILDPVGVGATEFRKEAAFKILKELDLTLIKGNRAEIAVLAEEKAELKGVESIGEYKNMAKIAQKLAQKENSLVAVSAKVDILAGEEEIFYSDRGSYLMGEIVGTGCMLGSTLAVFAAVESKLSLFEKIKTALIYYAYAGEIAALKTQTPAKFKREFMDTIYLLANK
ncbi:hydroxyethylthiazole kinase [Halanaerobium hydrogeniformans]|uniref:Hydroxyethylthiazole kinase n=1 Tax=Halanaerobium hydrogeniformans TaxID=656519 RepID=E4RMV0_HALHG|nr:hydroxyethylthiazole kinase [Halanaerobium hydrogeniformans]ADQ14167.1 Hydroxyethylthiazole kinase [Halanaerobium hydrogeniformans]